MVKRKITVDDLKVVQELKKENGQLKAENEKLLQDLEKITKMYIETCKNYSEQIQRMQAQNVQEICEKSCELYNEEIYKKVSRTTKAYREAEGKIAEHARHLHSLCPICKAYF